VNLARRRSQALTVMVLKPWRRSFAAGAHPGARIEAKRPEQIETAEGK
jgi:hypothetical protein